MMDARRSTRIKTGMTPAVPKVLSKKKTSTRFDRYHDLWMAEHRARDEVHRSLSSLKAAERTCGMSIQPCDHALPETVPTIASDFGLQRFVPQQKIALGSRNIKCSRKGIKDLTNCCRTCIPAFLYT